MFSLIILYGINKFQSFSSPLFTRIKILVGVSYGEWSTSGLVGSNNNNSIRSVVASLASVYHSFYLHEPLARILVIWVSHQQLHQPKAVPGFAITFRSTILMNSMYFLLPGPVVTVSTHYFSVSPISWPWVQPHRSVLPPLRLLGSPNTNHIPL